MNQYYEKLMSSKGCSVAWKTVSVWGDCRDGGVGMTYIELFDEDALENVCVCMTNQPSRVVLLGSDKELMEEKKADYEKLLNRNKQSVEFIVKTVNQADVGNIVEVISELIEKYDDCVLELTGGGDLYLAAVGVVMEKYRHKNLKVQRYSPAEGLLYEMDENYRWKEPVYKPITLSVEDNIRLYGGGVIRQVGHRKHTPKWDMNDKFMKDIDVMWRICRRYSDKWNAQISALKKVQKGDSKKALSINGSMEDFDENWLNALRANGIFTDLTIRGKEFWATYKNLQVRECLSQEGNVLEMKIYATALRLRDEENRPIYHSAENGVCIDWDGDSQGTYNEIDVMLMRGAIPIFISCKNGDFSADEVFKLKFLAERFGGKYVKRVLVATKHVSKDLIERAEEMNVQLISDLYKMDDAKLSDIIRNMYA